MASITRYTTLSSSYKHYRIKAVLISYLATGYVELVYGDRLYRLLMAEEYVLVFVYAYVFLYVFLNACVDECVNICACVSIHVRLSVCACMCVSVCLNLCTHKCVCGWIFAQLNICVCRCGCVHASVSTYSRLCRRDNSNRHLPLRYSSRWHLISREPARCLLACPSSTQHKHYGDGVP